MFHRVAQMHWTRQVAFVAIVGLLMAVSIVGAFAVTLHYVAPATNRPSGAPTLRPIVENGWIKVPSDINRKQECLANATITLRRAFDYGADLGVREDVVVIGLYNTTITGLGLSKVMLWFREPTDLGPGAWGFDGKVQDDCGGIGDVMNFSMSNPRQTTMPAVIVIPDPAR